MQGRSSIDMLLSKNRDILNRASMMADQKASIILGSEFIILSLIVTGIWRISQESDNAAINTPVWSVVIFAFILLSVFFSLIVLVPSISIKKNKKQKSGGSLLFFASIAQMEHGEYQKEMKQLISDDGAIYEAIISDLYFEAKVLHEKKYRYLKLSYLSLIIGVFLAMVVYCIEIFAS